jgi:NADH-quinone oxidoreductase subunit L
VGLCSYLLIGYYFDRDYASRAAMKAFITNRVGDFGFLIGLMLVFFQLQTLDLDEAAARFAAQYAAWLADPASASAGIFASDFTFFGWSLATIMGIGLFCGAMGKSAQFPLHVWLPDAMAGPTPVSALIHAATMVAAGVYLVARIFRLMTPDALMFVAAIGCLTLFLMSLVAIVQTDIKKCLAYSTLSQLGYMIFGMGCGAWIAALFHLITHAFFKAMLFLGSGQVIEGCHHEQDMRKMGGLMKKMPVTGMTFLIGVLAISGFGIAGTRIGLGGFFSKDEILAVAYVRAFEWGDPAPNHSPKSGSLHSTIDNRESAIGNLQSPISNRQSAIKDTPALPKWMFFLAILTAYVTPFYMMRCWWLTFMGKPRDEHVHHHAHEVPLMYVPLVVLGVGTWASGYYLFRPLIADTAPSAAAAPLVLAIDGQEHSPAIEAAHHWLVFGVGGAFFAGFAVALAVYARGLATAEAIRRLPLVSTLYIILEHKYFFDEVYDFLWVKGTLLVSRIARFIDTWVIDAVFDTVAMATERLAAFSGLILDNQGVDGVVNGVAKTSLDIGNLARGPQTGRIRNYLLFAAAVTTVVILALLVFGRTAAAGR